MDIPAVHLHSFGVVDITAATSLPHAGDAWKDGVVFFDKLFISRYFCLHDRTGSHEAHFPFQHVPKLGKFVEAGLSEEGAALCDAGIVFQLEFFIPFRFRCRVGSQEVLQYFFRVYAHGTEFVAVEFFSVFPYPPMLENDGARGVVIDPNGNGQKDGRYEDTAAEGGHDIEDPFQQLVPGAGQVIPDMKDHDFRIKEGFCSHIGHGDSHQIRNHVYLFHQRLGAVNKV